MVVILHRYAWLLGFLYLAAPNLVLAEVAFSELSEKEQAKVEAGKVVVHAISLEQEYIKEIHAFLKIDASAPHVFDLITDYERLPEFMPNLEAIEVLEQDNDGALVNYILALPFGVSKRYRLQLTYSKASPDWRMAWQSVPWEGLKAKETIVSTQGYWLLKPLSNSQTMLMYYTKTDPGHVPFGLGWIVDYLTKTTVVELLKNTKKRAEQQWQEQ